MSTKILIVDNLSRWKEFVQQDLSEFDTVFVDDDDAAIEQLAVNHFDLVIVGSRYIDVLERIQEKHPQQKAVVTTVQPNTQEEIRAYRLGALRYFTKSFKRNDLLNHTEELIPTTIKEIGTD